MASIQGVYVALFGRPADPFGLAFFNNATKNGADLTAIGDLSASAEYQNRFAGQSSAQIINSIYKSLFNRDADLAGLTFFANALATGALSINNIAIAIFDGAQGTDITTRDLKVASANTFTTSLDTGAEVVAYSGTAAANAGVAFLTGITTTAATQAQADAAIAQIVTNSGTGGGVPGQIYTLTVGADALDPTSATAAFKTTAGDDTIRAITALSLETVDVINGGSGNDTLNVSAGAIVVAGATPVLTSVETVNITSTLATDLLNLSSSTGINAINVTSTNAASVVTLKGVATLATTIGTGLSTATGVIDVDFTASTSGAADTLKVSLGNNNANTMTIKSTADTGTFEAISIAANGSKSGTSVAGNNAADVILFNNADFNTVKSISITGSGNSNITSASAVLTTVEAASASGNNTYAFAGAANKTINSGSGNDNITSGAGNDTLNGGDGNDTMFGAAGNDIYNGGKGADTYNDGAGTDTFTIETSTIEDLGFDTVAAGFATTVDTIKFVGGPAGSAANYAAVTTAGTGFVSARSAALTSYAGDTALKYVAVQDVGGKTFVFFDGNGDHLLDTNGSDFAVQLTGVAIANLAFGDITAA